MMVRHIPNILTLANLLCGCIGIVEVFKGNPAAASYLIILAAVFDFLDGFVAKLLHATSAIGKDLDSLADVVTFGVLPAVILFHLLKGDFPENEFWAYGAFIVALLSALRLARFNNDDRQTDHFIGVPTPANALLIASFPHLTGDAASWVLGNPWLLLGLSLVLGGLLVAQLPLLALKFQGFQWKGNEQRYTLIGTSLVLLLLSKWNAVPIIMLIYLALSWIYRDKSYAKV